MQELCDLAPPGVVTGKDLLTLMQHARRNGYAIPRVHCTTLSCVNAAMQAARMARSPIVLQLSDWQEETVALVLHIRQKAVAYGIPVVVHVTQCCCGQELASLDEIMLQASRLHYTSHGVPLVSMHTLDFNAHDECDNLAICVEYFKRMAPLKLWPQVRLRDGALVATFIKTLGAVGDCFSVVLEDTTFFTMENANDESNDDADSILSTGVVATKHVDDIAAVGEACTNFGSSGKYYIVIDKRPFGRKQKLVPSVTIEGIILLLLLMAGGAQLLAFWHHY